MGVYANGQIMYGFVHDDASEELFKAVTGENEEDTAFEELHYPLQEKHHVSLFQVGYEGVDIIAAYSASASSKGMDIQPVPAEDLAKTEEYAKNIAAFLEEIGIDASVHRPGWYILGYMD